MTSVLTATSASSSSTNPNKEVGLIPLTCDTIKQLKAILYACESSQMVLTRILHALLHSVIWW